MDKEDGRKLSTEALRERRKTIVRMKKANNSLEEIIAATGACATSVYNIWKQYEANGHAAFNPQKRGNKYGQGRHLTPDQEKVIQKHIVNKCPEQYQLDFALWTRQAVQQLIKQKSGIEMPIRSVGEYLKRWGFTPQKPTKFAIERKPSLVKEWLENTYPKITVEAKSDKADIYWGDETGIRASDVRGRGFAPRGKTPIVEATATYQNLSMVSAITNKGKVGWMIVEGSVNAEKFKDFLERLVRSAKRKVYLILDNLRVHHSKPVQKWLEEHKKDIRVFYLPPYSPDLNPDEHLNSDLKYGIGSKAPIKTKATLRAAGEEHMAMLEKNPDRIIKYFDDPAISYAKL